MNMQSQRCFDHESAYTKNIFQLYQCKRLQLWRPEVVALLSLSLSRFPPLNSAVIRQNGSTAFGPLAFPRRNQSNIQLVKYHD
jgi:hypothetical protein